MNIQTVNTTRQRFLLLAQQYYQDRIDELFPTTVDASLDLDNLRSTTPTYESRILTSLENVATRCGQLVNGEIGGLLLATDLSVTDLQQLCDDTKHGDITGKVMVERITRLLVPI